MPDRPTRCKHIVGLNFKYVKESKGTQHTILNVFDLTTMYNISFLCVSKEPTGVANTLKGSGCARAGIPETHVVENGPEFGAGILTYTSDNVIFNRVRPVVAPWHHGVVERFGQAFADLIHAILAETNVAGTEHMTYVLLTAALAKHRRQGRTGHSPRAFIYGLDERVVASEIDNDLEQPSDAELTRNATAHLRNMQYRKIAMRAVVELDRSERWREANKYPFAPSGGQVLPTR